MTDIIEAWARFAEEQQGFFTNQKNSFYGSQVVTYAVSKTFEGEMTQDWFSRKCLYPESLHMHYPGSFTTKTLAPYRCDSELSQKLLSGHLTSDYKAMFQDLDPTKRGCFFGDFNISSSGKGATAHVRGAIDGMINVGVIRDPMKKPFEQCHQSGRWYGRLHASVALPDREVAFLTGILGFENQCRVHGNNMTTRFIGTLEGFLIRRCQKFDG